MSEPLSDQQLVSHRRVLARVQLPDRRADLPAWQIRCCASRCAPSTSSRACSAIGARRRGRTSSTFTSIGSSASTTPTSFISPVPATAVRRSSRTPTSRVRTPRFIREVAEDAEGMRLLFRQFSTPGGVPSHAGPHVPGSIHEGGELGYSLVHAFGAAFDNPELIVACVIGDGEAETGPLEGAWKGVKFLNPARDGAVLPILHLNGYKISGPTVLRPRRRRRNPPPPRGHGYEVHFVEGDEPMRCIAQFAATLDACYATIRAIQTDARATGVRSARRGPRSCCARPRDGPGRKSSTACRSKGPSARIRCRSPTCKENPEHLKMLEQWMRSYRPEELFDDAAARCRDQSARAERGAPDGRESARERRRLLTVPLEIPSFTDTRSRSNSPERSSSSPRGSFGAMLRDIFTRNTKQQNFRLFCPDETNSNRLGAVFEVENRCLVEPRR